MQKCWEEQSLSRIIDPGAGGPCRGAAWISRVSSANKKTATTAFPVCACVIFCPSSTIPCLLLDSLILMNLRNSPGEYGREEPALDTLSTTTLVQKKCFHKEILQNQSCSGTCSSLVTVFNAMCWALGLSNPNLHHWTSLDMFVLRLDLKPICHLRHDCHGRLQSRLWAKVSSKNIKPTLVPKKARCNGTCIVAATSTSLSDPWPLWSELLGEAAVPLEKGFCQRLTTCPIGKSHLWVCAARKPSAAGTSERTSSCKVQLKVWAAKWSARF